MTPFPLCVFSAHRYTDKWSTVDYCTGITRTECDLSSLIHEYDIGYKVKVQLVVGRNASAWKKEKFLPKASRCGEKSASETLKLWLVELLLLIFTHHLSCRQTAAPVVYFIAYIQLSDSYCPPKTHFTSTFPLWGHLQRLPGAGRRRQKGDCKCRVQAHETDSPQR